MKRRALAALGLAAYAGMVMWGVSAGGGPVVAQTGTDAAFRLGLALVLAAAVLLHRAESLALTFALALGTLGLVSLAAQLNQAYVPDAAGLSVIPNGVALATTLGSTAALAVTAIALVARPGAWSRAV